MQAGIIEFLSVDMPKTRMLIIWEFPKIGDPNIVPLAVFFFIVWAVLILIEPTLGYAPLRAIPAHHGESYLRRDISSYDGLRKPTRYGGLGDLSCKTSKPLRIFSYRYSRLM